VTKNASAGPEASISAKQRAFVNAYITSKNATEAAREAGYKQPHSQGSRLLKNVGIASAIAKAQSKAAEKSGVNLEYVLQRLAIEAEREDERSSHAARVSALGHLRQHFEAAGDDDSEPQKLRFDIHVNAPVGDVRVTKPK